MCVIKYINYITYVNIKLEFRQIINLSSRQVDSKIHLSVQQLTCQVNKWFSKPTYL